jgi:hypothetical protein
VKLKQNSTFATYSASPSSPTDLCHARLRRSSLCISRYNMHKAVVARRCGSNRRHHQRPSESLLISSHPLLMRKSVRVPLGIMLTHLTHHTAPPAVLSGQAVQARGTRHDFNRQGGGCKRKCHLDATEPQFFAEDQLRSLTPQNMSGTSDTSELALYTHRGKGTTTQDNT